MQLPTEPDEGQNEGVKPTVAKKNTRRRKTN